MCVYRVVPTPTTSSALTPAGHKSTQLAVPMTPLEQLTEFKEIFNLIDHQFIVKRYNSKTSGWQRCIGHSSHMPSPDMSFSPISPYVHRSRALQTLSFWGLMIGFITDA